MIASPEFLRALPKVELHCHLEGSVPAATAVALAAKNDRPLPTTNPDELFAFSSLEEFLVVYRAISLTMVDQGDFATVTYDALAAAAAAGVRYREMAFNPSNHPDLTVAEMLAGIGEGIDAAQRDHGIRSRVIVAINREQPASTAEEVVAAAVAAGSPYVVGVGLDHNELLGPPERFAEAFRIGREAGLRGTAHSGERGDAAEIAATIEHLRVDRIDHGYAALLDPGLLRSCVESGLHYATCWTTAQVHSAGAADPTWIGAMIDAGLDVSISSDDPPYLATDMAREFERAGAALGWSEQDARDCVRRGARAAFLDDAAKAELVGELEQAFA